MKTNDEVIKPYLSEYIEFNGENISRYYLYNNQETLAFSALWDWTGYGFSFTDEFPVLDKTIKIESEATEESIKALDGRNTPYVLHLATHGFFFPDPIQQISKELISSVGKSKIYSITFDNN